VRRPRSSRRCRTFSPVPTGTCSSSRRRPCVDRGQLVDHRPDRGEVGVARVRRRRPDRDVDELGAVDRLATSVVNESAPRSARSAPRGPARRSAPRRGAALDPLGTTSRTTTRVAELGEARARDEPDVARAEDGDALPLSAHVRAQVVARPLDLRTFASGAGPSRSRSSSRSRAGRAAC
jgi:hypothetical protein